MVESPYEADRSVLAREPPWPVVAFALACPIILAILNLVVVIPVGSFFGRDSSYRAFVGFIVRLILLWWPLFGIFGAILVTRSERRLSQDDRYSYLAIGLVLATVFELMVAIIMGIAR